MVSKIKNEPHLINQENRAIAIRMANAEDAEAIACLLPVLNYKATPHEIRLRLDLMSIEPENIVVVAETEHRVVGLCQVQGVRLVASEGYAEVNTLVVGENHRRLGIGKSLVGWAIDGAQKRRYSRLRLWSGIQREEAHRFYETYGFNKSRTSHAFELLLPADQD